MAKKGKQQQNAPAQKSQKNKRNRKKNRPQPQVVNPSAPSAKTLGVVARNVNSMLHNHTKSIGLQLTKFMTLPMDTPSLRLPTRDMSKTAVMKTRNTVRSREITSVGVDMGTTMLYLVTGYPALAYMCYPYPTNSTGRYTMGFSDKQGKAAVSNLWFPWKDTIVPLPESSLRLSRCYIPIVQRKLTSGVGYSGPGQYQPLMQQDGVNYVFLQQQETVVVTAANVPTGTEMVVFMNRMMDVGMEASEVAMTILNSTTLQYSFSAPAPGWYNFELEGKCNMGAENVSFAMLSFTTNAAPTWGLFSMAELGEDLAFADATRRTACTLLVTNTTSKYSVAGDVVAARLQLGVPWADDEVTSLANIMDKLNVASDRYVGKAANGCYTYLDFTESDETFREVCNRFQNPVFTPDEGAFTHVISFFNPSLATTPSSHLVTCDMAIEFKTASQRYITAVPDCEPDALQAARGLNNSTSYFFENPLHWRDIENYARRAWGLFRDNASLIAKGVSAVFPEAAPAAMAVGHLLQR